MLLKSCETIRRPLTANLIHLLVVIPLQNCIINIVSYLESNFPVCYHCLRWVAGGGGDSTRVGRIQFYILLCFTYSAVLCIVLFWGPVPEYQVGTSRVPGEQKARRVYKRWKCNIAGRGQLPVPASGCQIGTPYNMQQSI